MRKLKNLKSVIYNSNKFKYGQMIVKNDVILTIRSDFLSHQKILINKEIYFFNLLNLYNSNNISYTTIKFLLKKFNLVNKLESNYSFLNLLTEFSWESGIISNKERELTFIKN